ncbi:unnamed protein product [Knipowitschia caucasica]|uniref:Uncharacterized protein n=1 Tax=Knipowitschia caucasica TaxID=637954 RepID=A0AAV2KRB3_KNICA
MGHLAVLFSVFLFVHSWDQAIGAAGLCGSGLEFRCDDGWCVSRLEVCDGRPQCDDGSDERECDERVCKSGEFFCDDGHCVSVLFLCDGTDHCSDGSDERSCPNCTSGFRCAASGWCLSQQQLCDGQSDCEDARDEDPLLCASQTTSCAASELQCRDGRCIHHSYKCDNTNDCSDGSDEEDCDVNECLLNNGGCPSVCVDEPRGFHCECPNNTRQRGDGHCEEMNPCLEADVCDQLCSYSEDHLSCRCQEDYEEDHQEDHQEGTAARACRAKGYCGRTTLHSYKL